MAQAEAHGMTSEIFNVQMSPEIGKTQSVTTYRKVILDDFATVQFPGSLLSSAPLTQRQIELGQKIAEKYGLTE